MAVYYDLVRYRELFSSLFRRDLRARYKGSVLGVAWSLANHWWLDYLLSFPDRSTQGYEFAFDAWPTVALSGPILLMLRS